MSRCSKGGAWSRPSPPTRAAPTQRTLFPSWKTKNASHRPVWPFRSAPTCPWAWGRATGPDLESSPRAESAWRPPFSLPWGGLAVGPALTRAARGEVLADRSCRARRSRDVAAPARRAQAGRRRKRDPRDHAQTIATSPGAPNAPTIRRRTSAPGAGRHRSSGTRSTRVSGLVFRRGPTCMRDAGRGREEGVDVRPGGRLLQAASKWLSTRESGCVRRSSRSPHRAANGRARARRVPHLCVLWGFG